MTTHRMFSTENPKAAKAVKYGYLNAIHYMAPASVAGVGNLCPNASEGCKAACLGWYSGQSGMVKDQENDTNNVRKSRIAKAQWFMRDRASYMLALVNEIDKLVHKAEHLGLKLCVRLNGSTDIAWEGLKVPSSGYNLMDMFPEVQFVDYTKIASRFNRVLPSNYHLTFSRSETNEIAAIDLLGRGHNVAVVFAAPQRTHWRGFAVWDGDQHDLRHLDPKGGFVIGLTPKGRKAAKDTSGFVVRSAR